MEIDYDPVLQAARENRPSEFQAHVNDILGQKIMDALERRRQELAQSAFVTTDQEDSEQEFEFDTSEDEAESEINNDEVSSESDDVDDTQIEEPNGQDA